MTVTPRKAPRKGRKAPKRAARSSSRSTPKPPSALSGVEPGGILAVRTPAVRTAVSHADETTSGREEGVVLRAAVPSVLTPEQVAQWERRWVTGGRPQAAAHRIVVRSGSTEAEKARWLLDFAFLDLNALSPGDWLNLRAELHGFCCSKSYGYEWSPELAGGWDPFFPEDQNIRELQLWLRSGLMTLVLGHRDKRASYWKIEYQASLALRWNRGVLMDWNFPGAAGPGADLFRFRVYSVLSSEASRFRSCLECRRPFMAEKRQEYCWPRCSDKARMRRFRQQQLPAVRRQRRRAAYEKLVHKRLGPNVRIGTRRRPEDSSSDQAREATPSVPVVRHRRK